jgi:hypothetical protein
MLDPVGQRRGVEQDREWAGNPAATSGDAIEHVLLIWAQSTRIDRLDPVAWATRH